MWLNEVQKIGSSSRSPTEKKRNDAIFFKKSSNGKPNNLKILGFMSGKLFISDLYMLRDHCNFYIAYSCRRLKRQS